MAERLRQRLDLLLVGRGVFESRAKARAAIEAGLVIVNGQPAQRASDLVPPDAEISAQPAHAFVGRGALKLAHALDLWPVSVEGCTCLDIGASTGGFTEVLLARGAARVFAVDVGRGQLHPRIAADARVLNLEGTDARSLSSLEITEAPSLITCDVSFISLAKALPAALRLAAPQADLVALVKPQFEVGPDRVGKGGIVKDAAARQAALDGAAAFLVREGWAVEGMAESPIEGGSGNREWLLWARRDEPKRRPPARRLGGL